MVLRKYAALSRGSRVLLAYLLIPLLVGLTTALLYTIEYAVIRPPTGFIRPYGIGYMFAVVLVTGIGGKRPGSLCLASAMAASYLFLVRGHPITPVGAAATHAEFWFMAGAGLLVVFGTSVIREHATAAQTAQSQAVRAAAMSRIENSLRTYSDPVAMQHTAVRELAGALVADRCYLMSFDPAQNAGTTVAEYRRNAAEVVPGEFAFADLHASPGQIFPNGTAIAVSHITRSHFPPLFQQMLERAGIRALLSVPHSEDGRLVSAITVTSDRHREWTVGEIHLVQEVESRLRSALLQARMRQRERLVTATMQDALLPSRPEQVPGVDVAAFYKPALEETSVGGDYFDIFRIRDSQYALVVGDISGKGVQAAVEAATIRHMLRVLLFENASVSDAVGRLNEIVVQQETLRGFTTLFVAVYDRDSRILSYVSCGHEPGLLCRGGAQPAMVEQLAATGPILGIEMDHAITEHRTTLFPGDILALYTDGVTDIGPDFGNLLGTDGLARLMAEECDGQAGRQRGAGEILDALIAGIQGHDGAELRDDACLLVAVILDDTDALVSEAIRGTQRQGL